MLISGNNCWPWECNQCEIGFSESWRLNQHIEMVHHRQMTLNDSIKKTKKNPYDGLFRYGFRVPDRDKKDSVLEVDNDD